MTQRNQQSDIHLEKNGQEVRLQPGFAKYSGLIKVFAFGTEAVEIVDKHIPEHRNHLAVTRINYAPPIEMFEDLKSAGFIEVR